MKGTDRKGPEGITTVLNISAPNKLLGNKKQGRLLHIAYKFQYLCGQGKVLRETQLGNRPGQMAIR